MSDKATSTPRRLTPYDTTIADNLSMYDHLPYKRDADLCNRDSLGLVSGNVIKFFRYNRTEPYEVNNMDDIITYKIAEVFHSSSMDMNIEVDQDEYADDILAETLTLENYLPTDTEEDIVD